MHMGLSEIAIIIILAIALIKPDKLKELAGSLGRMVKDIKDNKEEITEPVRGVLTETDRIREEIDDIKKDIIHIGDQ